MNDRGDVFDVPLALGGYYELETITSRSKFRSSQGS